MGIVKKYLDSHPFCKFTNTQLASELGIPPLQVKKEMLFILADFCPYSIAETAEIFGITKNEARDLLKTLPSARKINGRWYADVADVRAIYEAQND